MLGVGAPVSTPYVGIMAIVLRISSYRFEPFEDVSSSSNKRVYFSKIEFHGKQFSKRNNHWDRDTEVSCVIHFVLSKVFYTLLLPVIEKYHQETWVAEQ